MGKREDYEAKTEKLIAPIIAANHVELFDVDYVKEGQDWYLRVYIDKYIFEVSSPGLTRPLKKEKDYEKSLGRLIDIRLYKPVEGKKEYTGVLKEYNKDVIMIEADNSMITIERSNLSMIRWAYVEQ